MDTAGLYDQTMQILHPAKTSCKNDKTLCRKKAFLTANRIMRDKTHTLPPSPSFRVVPLWFEKGLVLLATLTREEG